MFRRFWLRVSTENSWEFLPNAISSLKARAVKKISELMTPREKLIVAEPGTSLEQDQEIFRKHKIEKLPLVDCYRRMTAAKRQVAITALRAQLEDLLKKLIALLQAKIQELLRAR